MSHDSGVAGCEDYDTCKRCNGSGIVCEDTAPEMLHLRIKELENKLRDQTKKVVCLF